MVSFNQIAFSGTVSGASFSADEQYTSTGNQEHIAGTFTTDIITATLTGPNENTDTNGIIVLRSGSSATMPPVVTASPTPTPTPAPALPTSDNLGSVSLVQGSVWAASTGQTHYYWNRNGYRIRSSKRPAMEWSQSITPTTAAL